MDPFSLSGIEEMIQRMPDAVEVVYSGTTTYGLHDWVDEVTFNGDAESVVKREVVRVATDVLSGLEQDAAITVDGTAYVILRHYLVEDGRETEIALRSPPS